MLFLLAACLSGSDSPLEEIIFAEPPSAESQPIRLDGAIYEAEEISGGALYKGDLYIVSDEGGALSRLHPTPSGFQQATTWLLPSGSTTTATNASGPELDLEALCTNREGLIAVGSHSAKRKKPKKSKPYEKNIERLSTLKPEPARRVILPLHPSAQGLAVGAPISIWEHLKEHAILGSFTGIPSKENGIDIEGASCTESTLTLGFRGPILRNNLVPVATFSLPGGALQQVRFVNLGGFGIRDIASLSDGFLLLTGPMGDAPAAGAIVHWDGVDCMPAEDRPPCKVTELDRWEARRDGTKAETLIVEQESPLQVLLLWEGRPGGERRTLR